MKQDIQSIFFERVKQRANPNFSFVALLFNLELHAPNTFKIEKDGDQWHTWSPELHGCHTHGKTVKEALENLKDAVQLYLEDILEEEIIVRSLELEHEAT